MKYLLGYDIGSSSVKAALLEIQSGNCVASAFSPESEMTIDSPAAGFAEQDPEIWWQELIAATKKLQKEFSYKAEEVAAIGISYQMHGLVCLDKKGKVLRPAIIWCDSRAVDIGNNAYQKIGTAYCQQHLLNSPGNFTASKLKWVKESEPEVYKQIDSIALPGDYIAFKLTGEKNTTTSGLSEGIFWDFAEEKISKNLLDHYGFDPHLIPPTVPQFGMQGAITKDAAALLHLKEGTPVTYRAGDQPNNAFSLNVLQPGEIAATAGTSGVVYGVTDSIHSDPASRVNTFLHVTHSKKNPRYGILLCINGTGILNSWVRKNFFGGARYEELNAEAATVPIGSEGILCYPFGNGAERVLKNFDPGAAIEGIRFNSHSRAHVARAVQEGIVFSLHYGIGIMKELGLSLTTVRAGYANMFLSKVFAEAFANTTGARLELYNTDGAIGAARAAGVGHGAYANFRDGFAGMEKVQEIDPDLKKQQAYGEAYEKWREGLRKKTGL
ncbi:MAG TPA: FGGY family carbohydrate kinase [Flavitalea sp.]|nr:FGGY family carbohydrate kinase [Flavitalea sp.]